MKMLMVSNIITYYRLPLYEELQQRVDLRLLLFSDGGEWYWRYAEQPDPKALRSAEQLSGFWVGRTRITPMLFWRVLRSKADVVVKDPNGKFALPVTYLAARLAGKPFVFWASLWEHPAGNIHRLTRPLMRALYRRADAIVTYGHHVTRYVVQEGADPSRVVISRQAVVSRPGGSLAMQRWTGRSRRLLFVGRLEPWKGLDVLLRALSDAEASWSLTVAGEGSAQSSLEALAHELGIDDRVTFLGKVPNSQVHELYSDAQFVFVPSVRTPSFSEPWALVVNEAMHAGAVVVASDAVGAVQDGLVRDGVTGYVFAAAEAQALSSTLTKALSEDPAVLAAIAQRGAEAASHFTHAAAADAFVAAAEIAMERRRQP